MIAWMVYAAVVGGVVAVGGWACERLSASAGRPRRIAWLAALTVAVVVPLTGGWRKPAAPVVETGAAEPPAIAGAVVGDLWSAIPALPVPDGVNSGRIAALLWGAGSLASLAVLGGVLVLVARGRRRWERRWVDGADIFVSRRFGPALVGVTKPEVVVPAWVLGLEPGARTAIIRHEAEHARARDHLGLLYGGLVVAAFPWNPAIWWMCRRLRAAVELDCDQRVLASGIGVADYGDVLLDAGSRCHGWWGFSPAMGQPRSLLERRLKTMSETRKKLSGGYATLLVAVAVGALVVACDTPVPKGVEPEAELIVVPPDRKLLESGQVKDWEWFSETVVANPRPGLRPVIYVDGVRLDDGESGLAGLDPERIDRIEVIKGEAARERYGKEAANGVILIFTKKEPSKQPAAPLPR